jgi:hypothetical protein
MRTTTRREFLSSAGAAAATLALPATAQPAPGRARSVIFITLVGGPSHVDTFDPKPALARYDGLPLRGGRSARTFFGEGGTLMKSPFRFQRHGASGLEVSELFPGLASHADDLCVIRTMRAASLAHAPALFGLHTGAAEHGRPSLGAWSVHARGLRGAAGEFAVLPDARGGLLGGRLHWAAGGLPDDCAGAVRFLSRSVEESEERRRLYGMERRAARDFGGRCMAAVDLVEQGACFVHLIHGGPGAASWDAHQDVAANHRARAAEFDGPAAGLLADLKRRGLLASTIVVCAGEFGRSPISANGTGRDHHAEAFAVWMAGGGVRGGAVIGETDELGLEVVEEPHTVRDLHATILHLLGHNRRSLIHMTEDGPLRPCPDGQIIQSALA